MEDKESLFKDEFEDIVEDSGKTDIDDITDDTEEANAVVEKVEKNEKDDDNAPDDVVKNDEDKTPTETTSDPDTVGNTESETETSVERGGSNENEEVKTESTFFYMEDVTAVNHDNNEIIMNDTYLGDTEILTVKDDVTLEAVPLDRNTRDTVTLNNPTGVLKYLVLGQEPIDEYTRQLDYLDSEFNNIVNAIEQWLTSERLANYYELSENLILSIPPSSEFEGSPIHLPDAIALQYFQMIRTKVKVQYQQSILSSIVIDNDKLPNEILDVLTWVTYLLTSDVIDNYINALTRAENLQ